jgi:hypothetical protein
VECWLAARLVMAASNTKWSRGSLGYWRDCSGRLMPACDRVTDPAQILRQVLLHLGCGSKIVVDVEYEKSKVEMGMAKKKTKAILDSVSHHQKNELRASLSQLSDACPFHIANPEDCPLFPVRRMEPTKRLQWFDGLSESGLEYLAAYHRVCLTVKVKLGLANLRSNAPAPKRKRSRRREVE